jgi:methylmalonyl-CoA mutase N-terminal domain/subunit
MPFDAEDYGRWLEHNASRFGDEAVPTTTSSGVPVNPVYTPLDRGAPQADLDAYGDALGLPGQAPFTRGIKPGMYREGLWVMGMYSGRASPRETNERIRKLLEAGGSGFSIALDLPTQLGLDADDPRARGEVGRVGVPLSSLADMIELLDGVPLAQVSQIRTTANAIGPIATALFVAAAEELGVSPSSFKVMLQNDVLKEYVARNTFIFPYRHGRDFSVDVIEYCARELPHWEPIEFCGYHIRDAGSTAVQEAAIAIANGIEYLEHAVKRGLDIDAFGHSAYLFFSAGLDIFEEVAKFRASRRIWYHLMRERFGAKKDSSCAVNIFCYTLGSAQTAVEPLNNIARIAYQALAAALGGVQTLATSSFDEALGLPSPEAAHVGLRTQQILGLETGVARSADPLGGSYLVESLTDRLETEIRAYLTRIDEMGGAVAALESGFFASELEREAYEFHRGVEEGTRPVVGLNRFVGAGGAQPSISAAGHSSLDAVESEQVEKLAKVRASRNQGAVTEALSAVATAGREGRNTIPPILDAVRSYATIGEICSALASVWGRSSVYHS